MNDLKKCLACGKTLTGNRKYCPEPSCQRRAASGRKARSRAKPAVTVTELVPGPEAVGYLSPWGQRYGSRAEAWAEAILAGGLAGDLEPGRRAAYFDALRAVEGRS